MTFAISSVIQKSIEVKQLIYNSETIIALIKEIIEIVTDTFRCDKKVFFCGNGGSAADAQHLAAELSGKFNFDRKPLFAEALHVNSSYLTAVVNDYSYEEVFSRLIEAKGRPGDILVTSSVRLWKGISFLQRNLQYFLILDRRRCYQQKNARR